MEKEQCPKEPIIIIKVMHGYKKTLSRSTGQRLFEWYRITVLKVKGLEIYKWLL